MRHSQKKYCYSEAALEKVAAFFVMASLFVVVGRVFVVGGTPFCGS